MKEKLYKKINQFLDEKSRIFFTPLNEDGLDDMYEYSVMPEFYKYLEFPPHRNKEDTRNYIKKLIFRTKESDYNTNYWFINLKPENKIIGTIGIIKYKDPKTQKLINDVDELKKYPFEKIGEVGKGLSPKYWRKGLMSEAFVYYLRFCNEVLKLDILWAITRSDNQPNIKLMEKFGFKKNIIIPNFYKNFEGKSYDGLISTKKLI